MKIILAEHSGFCFGVKRACQIADESLAKYKTVYSTGPLIHNDYVVNDFAEKGLKIEKNIDKLKRKKVLIRSHGISAGDHNKIKKNKNVIIDATCPFVNKVVKSALQMQKEGRFILIIGDDHHPEVDGIKSFLKQGGYKVIAPADFKENIKDTLKNSKLGIVCQTTQSIANLKKIILKILEFGKDIRIMNTICGATERRQRSAIKVARKADIMLVIGGKNSANTARLYEICRKVNPNTHHIETLKDLKKLKINAKGTAGLAAGASTPGYLIESVIKYLERQ